MYIRHYQVVLMERIVAQAIQVINSDALRESPMVYLDGARCRGPRRLSQRMQSRVNKR